MRKISWNELRALPQNEQNTIIDSMTEGERAYVRATIPFELLLEQAQKAATPEAIREQIEIDRIFAELHEILDNIPDEI